MATKSMICDGSSVFAADKGTPMSSHKFIKAERFVIASSFDFEIMRKSSNICTKADTPNLFTAIHSRAELNSSKILQLVL